MKKGLSLRQKMVLVILPAVLIFNLVTLGVTVRKTREMAKTQADFQLKETSAAVGYEISANIQRIRGLLENVKTSVEKSCETEEEIQDYMYGIADGYLDIIPAGIYGGLESGTYMDKMWQPEPEDNWVMKERPWYVEGLKADKVTFGEMYMDANTNDYIISGFSNIKDKDGNVIGVICADIELDGVDKILTSRKIYDNGYVYAIDCVADMILSNSRNPEQNGNAIETLDDEVSKITMSALRSKTFGNISETSTEYVLVDTVPDTNFAIVLVAERSDVQTDVNALLKSVAIIFIVGTILICLIAYVTMFIMLRPIKSISKAVDRMHDMDLTGKVSIRTKDELGAMSSKVNQLTDNLKTVITDISTASSQLNDKAENNGDTAAKLKELSGKQGDSVHALEDAMSEMSGSIENLAEGANRLSSDIHEADRATDSIRDRVNEMSDNVKVGEGEVSGLSKAMEEMSDITAQLIKAVEDMRVGLGGIKGFVSTINDVAEETNLLSLNASIEAARAGDAGKSFAVVAQEIHALAEQTAKSAEEIVNTTNSIEKLMNDVTEAATSTSGKVDKSCVAADKTNKAFATIASHVHEINSAVDEISGTLSRISSSASDIATSATEQNAGARSILDDCTRIAGLAEELDAEGGVVEQSGLELTRLSGQLTETISRFKL